MVIISQIESLMTTYAKLIADDHHKTQDGTIEIDYNVYTGQWSISHPGYINKFDVTGITFDKALDRAIKEIEGMIRVEEQIEKEENLNE